jgi:inosine-uridine nucleoside N-ribohydrolase
VTPAPGPLDAALTLLKRSIGDGALVIGIGPYTNLALLDEQYPGILQRTDVTLVGGWTEPPRPTRSSWGNEMDYNVQMDIAAAEHVLTRCRPTLVPLHATVETTLRHADLPVLDTGDAVSQLMARQARSFDAANELEAIDRETCTDLPPDFINHLYDPLGCAVALGWGGAVVEERPLAFAVEDGWLHERVAAGGILTKVVTRVDGPAFDALWLGLVSR